MPQALTGEGYLEALRNLQRPAASDAWLVRAAVRASEGLADESVRTDEGGDGLFMGARSLGWHLLSGIEVNEVRPDPESFEFHPTEVLEDNTRVGTACIEATVELRAFARKQDVPDIGGARVSTDEVDDGFDEVVISRAVVLGFDARVQPDFEFL